MKIRDVKIRDGAPIFYPLSHKSQRDEGLREGRNGDFSLRKMSSGPAKGLRSFCEIGAPSPHFPSIIGLDFGVQMEYQKPKEQGVPRARLRRYPLNLTWVMPA